MKLRYSKERYQASVEQYAPKSKLVQQLFRAFWVGGAICAIGEGLSMLYRLLPLSKEQVGTLTSVSILFLTVLFTGLGWFDRIGSYAGAGTVIPITGFGNAIAAPAMEYRPEGFVLGVGARMFTIAGPVIVYGVLASAVYGGIYWLCRMW